MGKFKKVLKKILSKSPLDFYHYIRSIKIKQPNDNTLIRSYLNNNIVKKLQIGCGHNSMAGWLNTDLDPKSDGVVKLDAGKTFPFPDNTFDFIFSEHIFEHLTFDESCNFLSESYRVLKPNGIIRIATPDINFLFEIYKNPQKQLHKKYIKWMTENFCKSVATKFSGQEYSGVYGISNFFKDFGHQIIHNYESLSELMSIHNFINIEEKGVGKSEFKDLCNIERHWNIISKEFNELETMVIEGQKLG